MKNILINLSNMLYTIRQLFAGDYKVLRKEEYPTYNTKVPTFADSMANVKNDLAVVWGCLKKAIKEKEEELSKNVDTKKAN